MFFHLKTLMPLKIVPVLKEGKELSNLLRISAIMDVSDRNLTYREAMKSSLKSEWIEDTQKEYNALIEIKNWVLSPLPRKRNWKRWVFKIKPQDDRTIEKFKARLVAQGFSQVFDMEVLHLLPNFVP